MNRILVAIIISILSFSAHAQQLKTVTKTDGKGNAVGDTNNAAIIGLYKSGKLKRLAAPNGEVLTGTFLDTNFDVLKPWWAEFYESGMVKTLMAPAGKSLGGVLTGLNLVTHNIAYVSIYLKKDGNGYIGFIKAPKGQLLKGKYLNKDFDALKVDSVLFEEPK